MDGGKLIYVSSRDEGLSLYDFRNMSKQKRDRTNLTPAHLLHAAATLPVCLKHRVNGYVTGSNEWTVLVSSINCQAERSPTFYGSRRSSTHIPLLLMCLMGGRVTDPMTL